MGLGILPDRHLGEDVPGTSLLDDLHGQGRLNVDASKLHLKRTSDGIVLVPQPSDSPNDPLNWPTWRKIALMCTITYGAGVVGAFGPIIAAGFTQVAESLHTTNDGLSRITGDCVLAIGLVLLLTAPASVIWGRRPVFLVGNVLLLASAISSALAKDVTGLTVSRVIGGAGMAPIECLVEATISDIFFVHERGKWIAVWSFALLGGISGVSIVNGYLIQDVSWRVCFLIEAVLSGILLVLTVVFVPETAYNRKDISTLQVSVESGVMQRRLTSSTKNFEPTDDEMAPRISDEKKGQQELVKDDSSVQMVEEETPSAEQRESFVHSLRLWSGHRFSHEPFLTVAKRPFTISLSPAVLWGALVYGTTNAWLVALSVCVSLLFTDPQFGYGFGAGPIGLISGVGPFIFTFIANAVAGPMSDWTAKWLSRRNRGVYEPEFRLVMIFPLFVTSTIGWFGWAISAHLQQLWIGPAIFYSLINFGMAVGAIAVVSYVVDAHPNYAPEAFASINVLKNFFAFGVTYFVTPWILNQGVLNTFCTIGGINMWVCLMTIPMYIFGKRARSWVHRTKWMLA